MLPLATPELLALLTGEVIVAFVARGTCTEGDEVGLVAGAELDAAAIKPAYRRRVGAEVPAGPWTAVVVAVDPAQLLDPAAGGARHVRVSAPAEGDLLVLRVAGPEGPVLSDVAFAARSRSVEGAMR